MDVTMKKRSVDCYNRSCDWNDSRDAAVETVVPDTMPDIERILCADGYLIIKSKEAAPGSMTVTAGIAASVLYVPEGERGIRSLSAVIPVSVTAEAPGISEDSIPVAMLTVSSVEARMLNPRKVVVRAVVSTRLSGYDRGHKEYCEGIDAAGARIQLLTENRRASNVVCVKEKTFVTADEFHMPAGKPAIGQVLSTGVELIAGDVKQVGNKLVVNGSAHISLTYLSEEEGAVASADFECGFSQLVEADTELNSPDCAAHLLLTAAYIEPATLSTGERGVSCELHAVVQVVCVDSVDVACIADCYSNGSDLEAECITEPWLTLGRRLPQHNAVHEELETETEVREILNATCRVVEYSTDGCTARCKISASVLYRDAEGELRSAAKRISAECELDTEDDLLPEVIAAGCSGLYTTPTQTGIDLRLNLDFDTRLSKTESLPQVVRISLAEEGEPTEILPSLVVVRTSEKDSLWQLAKRYHSTRDLIAAANGDEILDAVGGRVLLIPTDK